MDEKNQRPPSGEPVYTIGQCSNTLPQGPLSHWMQPCEAGDGLLESYEKDAEMPDLRAAGVRKIDFTKDKEACELSGVKTPEPKDPDFESMEDYRRKKKLRTRQVKESYSIGAVSGAAQEKMHFAAKTAEVQAELSPKPQKSILEQYKAAPEGTIRRTWADAAEKKELSGSGMPTYMQLIAEGKEEQYDQEMLKYCKLAGLKYVTTKQKMKKEIESIQKGMRDAISIMESRLSKLVESFKQLDIDED
jgi:hypothetical protein